MKTLVDIINEAEPVPGFKPAAPVRPKGPTKPAPPQRIRAKVMTPKGRITTVKKPQSLRKPGYSLIQYNLPDGGKNDRHPFIDRADKHPKKLIKPIQYGVSTG